MHKHNLTQTDIVFVTISYVMCELFVSKGNSKTRRSHFLNGAANILLSPL